MLAREELDVVSEMEQSPEIRAAGWKNKVRLE